MTLRENSNAETYPMPNPDFVGEYPAANMISYTFPLRDEFDARIVLPRGLTQAEVRRIVAFIMSLVEDEPHA